MKKKIFGEELVGVKIDCRCFELAKIFSTENGFRFAAMRPKAKAISYLKLNNIGPG